MIKIEVIILSIIAIVSFVIGVIIYIIDIMSNNSNKKDDNNNTLTDVFTITKTLFNYGLPKVEDYDDPVIIKTIDIEEDKDK